MFSALFKKSCIYFLKSVTFDVFGPNNFSDSIVIHCWNVNDFQANPGKCAENLFCLRFSVAFGFTITAARLFLNIISRVELSDIALTDCHFLQS